MSNLGQAYVQIIPSAKGISGKIQQQINGTQIGDVAGQRIGKGLVAKVGGVLAAAGIGAMLVKGIAASIKEGAALEQSLGGVETLFKNNAQTVIKNASQAYKTAGMSANEYMQNVTSFSASLLQSLGGDTKAAAKTSDMALRDMSDNANKFGTDMNRITDAYQGFAKQNYTMLDNLKLGYGGTKTEMQRLLADATKLTGVKYDINNLNDVYNAIHAVQNEMGITGTTAKEASKTLSGSFNSMKAAGKDLLGNLAIGGDVETSMKNLADSAGTFLFDNLLPAVGRVIMGLPSAIGTFITTSGPKLATKALELLQKLGQAIVENAPILFQKLSEGLSNAITKISEWNPLETSTAGTSLMGKIAQALVDNFPKIMRAVGIIVGKLALLAAQAIPKLGLKLISLIGRMIGQIATRAIQAVGQKITTVFTNIRTRITTKISDIKNNIVSKVKAIPGAIGNALSGLWKKFTQPFTTAKEKIKGIVDKIKNFFPFNLGKILKLQIPKISLSGGKAPWGIAGKGKLPTFHVGWNAQGGIFNKPTILQGLGEAGPEAALPLTPFWARMDQMGDDIINGVRTVAAAGAGGYGDIHLDVYLYPSGPKMMEETVKAYDTGKRRLG